MRSNAYKTGDLAATAFHLLSKPSHRQKPEKAAGLAGFWRFRQKAERFGDGAGLGEIADQRRRQLQARPVGGANAGGDGVLLQSVLRKR